ncbi:hypothetical protein [Caniella muris]|uniref:hypothetical protein n=1 Tax=Caniella muris TaxID=2941502 RepID=UPI00204252EE|nr:hypothetical protein [Caniella muris]
MRSVDAMEALAAEDRRGAYIWHLDGLGGLFGEEGDRLRGTVERLVAEGALGRVADGLYYNRLSRSVGLDTLYDFARALRPDGLSYESFESAASQWGIISQVPWRLTFATQGSGGEYRTPLGTVEFTHTGRDDDEILRNTSEWPDGRGRIASYALTLDDLLRHHRSVDLIDWEEVDGALGVERHLR